MRTRLPASILSAVALSIAFAGPAAAQSYPAKPIRVIVPVAAGSGLDVVARIATEKMSQNMGATLYIENLPGANSNIGAAAGRFHTLQQLILADAVRRFT